MPTGNLKVISLEGLGDIVLKKNPQAKRLSIRISPSKGVWVNIPRHYTYDEAHQFIIHQQNWIRKNLQKLNSDKNKQLVFDENTRFSTRNHQLKIVYEDRDTVSLVITKNQLLFRVPNHIDVRHQRIQKFVHKGIEEAMRLEAQQYLPSRIQLLAAKHGFSFQKTTIRRSLTRWGSCSANNNINLSLFLMILPDELIDYVLLHELVHTVHKNHGTRFKQMLEMIAGNIKEKEKAIKKYRIGIYPVDTEIIPPIA